MFLLIRAESAVICGTVRFTLFLTLYPAANILELFAAQLDLHSTMFLLIHTYSCWMGMITVKFTFHNVSINSETSVDFLPLITVFTFHNVSINSTAMVYP